MSKASFYLEKELFRSRIAPLNIEHLVFVTGLARAGTTVLFNSIYNTNAYASLKYSNMPFLLMPNLWSNLYEPKSSTLRERSHGDGILVNNESPEAFDEYFWKAFMDDTYCRNSYLTSHQIPEKTLNEYTYYIKMVCFSQNKTNYLTKNNNNILRLDSLRKLKIEKKIFLVVRHPLEHAMSLLKEHRLFCSIHQKDSFSLEYFDFLGHHEFGLHHKPIIFNEDQISILQSISKEHADYWLNCWKFYYQYVLEHLKDDISLIFFDDICYDPKRVCGYLMNELQLNNMPDIPNRGKAGSYERVSNEGLLQQCISIYDLLSKAKQY